MFLQLERSAEEHHEITLPGGRMQMLRLSGLRRNNHIGRSGPTVEIVDEGKGAPARGYLESFWIWPARLLARLRISNWRQMKCINGKKIVGSKYNMLADGFMSILIAKMIRCSEIVSSSSSLLLFSTTATRCLFGFKESFLFCFWFTVRIFLNQIASKMTPLSTKCLQQTMNKSKGKLQFNVLECPCY